MSTARNPNEAYPRFRRVKDAYRFIKTQSEKGAASLEATQSRFVAATYGIEQNLVKRMKAKFRNELSFGSDK